MAEEHIIFQHPFSSSSWIGYLGMHFTTVHRVGCHSVFQSEFLATTSKNSTRGQSVADNSLKRGLVVQATKKLVVH